MAFRLMASPDGIEAEDDEGRYFNVELHHDGTLELSASGLRSDSAATFDEDKYAPTVDVKFRDPEQRAEVIAALQAWLEQLDKAVAT